MTEQAEIAETIEMPALGREGEACRSCRAPLAADQRYCLNCGIRRAAPRLGFKEHLLRQQAAGEHPGPAAPMPAAPAARTNDWTPVVAFAGAVALAFMLVLGLLIGKGGGKQLAGPAPVIRVDGAGSQVAAAPTGKSKKANSKSAKGGAKASATDLTSGKKKSVQIDKSALSGLNTGNGADYAKKAAKLPDQINVSGKPPPVDNKAAGNGSGSQEFK